MNYRFEKLQNIAFVGLIIPALFAIGNIGFYVMNIHSFSGVVNTFGAILESSFGWLLNLIIIFDPILVVLITLTAMVEFQSRPEGNGLASLTLKKAAVSHYVVLGIGLALVTIFGIYFLAENWPCLIGTQVTC